VDEIAERPHWLPFFESDNDSLIFLDLSQETRAGIHPVNYAGVIIADSIEDFVRKLDARENYYLSVDEEL
jgi:hypothetical protein